MSIKAELIPIGSNAWAIQEPTVRSFLFAGETRALLIDSGCEIQDMRAIVAGLTKLPVILVNTHADADHIACNQQFDTIYMHPSEYAYYHRVVRRNDNLHAIWDQDVVDLGGRQFRCLHTPGHTPGSISLLNEEEGILVGGDGVQNGAIFLFGLLGAERDLLAYLHSLERLEKLSDRINWVYPSHADLRVPVSLIPKLADGVRRILNGTCPYVADVFEGISIRRYDIQAATILYEKGPSFFEP